MLSYYLRWSPGVNCCRSLKITTQHQKTYDFGNEYLLTAPDSNEASALQRWAVQDIHCWVPRV